MQRLGTGKHERHHLVGSRGACWYTLRRHELGRRCSSIQSFDEDQHAEEAIPGILRFPVTFLVGEALHFYPS
ncbi:hypothetical protein E2C01_008000 [Portunus trituberculatus]|uniref:Uncharacterized protein n=1 Tax=Portunus trituberculatus TaxID=210409 RepID=A0A5B7D1M0_PORTR|nr:hypothetical protein [Portunus trituberculatus]